MNRAAFLAKVFLPAAAVAGSLAAKVDPDGEPIKDTEAVIKIDAPGTTISNVYIDATGSRKTAIEATEKAKGSYIFGTTYYNKR